MALTDVQIRKKTCPTDKKQIKLYDGDGLFVLIKSNGSKLWRMRYKMAGKEKALALGSYPDVKLKEARRLTGEYNADVLRGVDPAMVRAKNKQKDDDGKPTFEPVAREWMEQVSRDWVDKSAQKLTTWMEIDVFPYMGGMTFEEIEAPDVLLILRRVYAAGHEYKLRKLHSYFSRIFSFAISHGKAKRNPAKDIVMRDLFGKVNSEHRPAFTTATDAGKLMRMIEGYEGSHLTRDALKLMALMFTRPGELRQMKWKEIDFKAKQWRYFVSKTSVEHIVPLSEQALSILEGLKPISSHLEFVFIGARSVHRPMSNNTMNGALRSMGIDTKTEHCSHGFRAMARTLLAEKGWNTDFIERQLCHKERDATVEAYARAKYLDDRCLMMQDWADYLDALRDGAQVIPFKRSV